MRHEIEIFLHQDHDGECIRHFNAKYVYKKFLRIGYSMLCITNLGKSKFIKF